MTLALAAIMAGAAPATSGALDLYGTGPSTVTMPDAAVWHFVAPGADSIAIFSDNGNGPPYDYRGGCSGELCTWSFGGGVWGAGGLPVTYSYHALAYVTPPGQPTEASNWINITVTMEPPPWRVSLDMPGEVSAPDSISVRYGITPAVDTSGRAVNLVDADNGQWTGNRCLTQTGSCDASLLTPWVSAPQTFNYRAEYTDGTTTLAQQSASVTVYPPSVNLQISAPVLVAPGQSYNVVVNNDFNGWTPYTMILRDGNGGVIGWCGLDNRDCSFSRTAGSAGTSQSYTAEVEYGGTIIAKTSPFVVESVDVNSLDLQALAAEFGSAVAVCNAVLFYPGSHQAESSVSDQWLACDEVARGGGTAEQALSAAIGAGVGVAVVTAGQSLQDWLEHNAWVNYGNNPPPPPAPGNPPANPADPPSSAPPSVVTDIDEIASTLRAKNPALAAADEADAEEIAKRCKYLVGEASLSSTSECETLPIFSPGSNYPTATQHRIDAIHDWPAWVRLTNRIGPRSSWYDSQPECAGSTVARPCDEFPENRTYEGGDPGATRHRPSLRQIDQADNSGLGGFFAVFRTGCSLTDSQSFLVIPTPPSLGIPSYRLCNAP